MYTYMYVCVYSIFYCCVVLVVYHTKIPKLDVAYPRNRKMKFAINQYM